MFAGLVFDATDVPNKYVLVCLMTVFEVVSVVPNDKHIKYIKL